AIGAAIVRRAGAVTGIEMGKDGVVEYVLSPLRGRGRGAASGGEVGARAVLEIVEVHGVPAGGDVASHHAGRRSAGADVRWARGAVAHLSEGEQRRVRQRGVRRVDVEPDAVLVLEGLHDAGEGRIDGEVVVVARLARRRGGVGHTDLIAD